MKNKILTWYHGIFWQIIKSEENISSVADKWHGHYLTCGEKVNIKPWRQSKNPCFDVMQWKAHLQDILAKNGHLEFKSIKISSKYKLGTFYMISYMTVKGMMGVSRLKAIRVTAILDMQYTINEEKLVEKLLLC